jgi:hypothetical protein
MGLPRDRKLITFSAEMLLSLVSRDHLFFSCRFSSRSWKDLIELCDLEAPSICWDKIVDVGKREWNKKVLKCFVCRLSFDRGCSLPHIYGALEMT